LRRDSRLRDWLFSGPKKHLLLRELILRRPDEGLTRTQLATRSQQHPKARVDLHLGPLVQAGLVVESRGRYRVNGSHKAVEPLRDLLLALDELPDEELRR